MATANAPVRAAALEVVAGVISTAVRVGLVKVTVTFPGTDAAVHSAAMAVFREDSEKTAALPSSVLSAVVSVAASAVGTVSTNLKSFVVAVAVRRRAVS